jgi:sugar porter (SP) family MFS transporter
MSTDKLDDVQHDEGSPKDHRSQRKSPEQRNAALRAALEKDPGVDKFSARAFYLYYITLVACFCSGDSGFDGTVMGGINAMAQYQHYFGLSQAEAKTGIVFGIFTIGALCATIPTAIFPDMFGRRFSMVTGNAVLIVGAAITATSKNSGAFIGGRFLTGFGSSLAGASAKAFLAEMTPPQSRGAYMGFLNSFYYVGQMSATGMMVSTGNWNNQLSWRLPLWIQAVPAGLNVLLAYTCPESPRWLYSRGRQDEARKILANLHSQLGDIHSPLVDIQMEEIEEYVSLDGSDKRWWDFRPLFRTRSDRYRAFMVAVIGSFGQLSGNGLITYFLPVLLSNAGITNQHRILVLNFVNSITSYAGALAGAFTIDRFGRRKNLLWGTGVLIVIFAIVTGLLSNPGGNTTRANAGITFIYLFMVVYSFAFTSMQALYPAEVLAYETRAKGLAFLTIIVQASSCINTFGLPSAISALGWKVYLIFTLWDCFEWVVMYLFIVETKGLTLEEIEEVFEQPYPRNYSIALRQQVLERQKQEASASA